MTLKNISHSLILKESPLTLDPAGYDNVKKEEEVLIVRLIRQR